MGNICFYADTEEVVRFAARRPKFGQLVSINSAGSKHVLLNNRIKYAKSFVSNENLLKYRKFDFENYILITK